MIGFKLSLVALVLLIANVIAIWKVPTSRWLLHTGSLIVGGVVLYSTYLLIWFHSITG